MRFLLALLASYISLIHSFSFNPMNIFQKASSISKLPYMRDLGTFMGSKLSANDVLKNPQFPEKWPFSPEDFTRQDQAVDSNFYYQPRFVYHIDDSAVAALTSYYAKTIKPNSDILDICFSWVSHYPPDITFKKAVGLGMCMCLCVFNLYTAICIRLYIVALFNSIHLSICHILLLMHMYIQLYPYISLYT